MEGIRTAAARLLPATVAMLSLGGCAPGTIWASPSPQELAAAAQAEASESQLQRRARQTREFPGVDTSQAMRALVDVLQDEGYLVENAVPELGLVSATKQIDVENPGEVLFKKLFDGNEARWRHHAVVEATANVSRFGTTTRVRVSFQVKTFDNRGATLEVETIDDPEFYQLFFSKLDKGIYIQREQL